MGSPRSLARRRLAGHGPRRGDLAGHLGEHEPQALLLGERRRRTPCARARYARRRLEAGAGDARRTPAAIEIRPSPSADSAIL